MHHELRYCVLAQLKKKSWTNTLPPEKSRIQALLRLLLPPEGTFLPLASWGNIFTSERYDIFVSISKTCIRMTHVIAWNSNWMVLTGFHGYLPTRWSKGHGQLIPRLAEWAMKYQTLKVGSVHSKGFAVFRENGLVNIYEIHKKLLYLFRAITSLLFTSVLFGISPVHKEVDARCIWFYWFHITGGAVHAGFCDLSKSMENIPILPIDRNFCMQNKRAPPLLTVPKMLLWKVVIIFQPPTLLQ